MKLTGAAILVSRDMKVLQADPAAYPYRYTNHSKKQRGGWHWLCQWCSAKASRPLAKPVPPSRLQRRYNYLRSVLGVTRMSHSPTQNIFEADDWEIGQGEIDGSHHIVRMRSTFPSVADQELFCRLVIITWRYEPNDSGMPDPDTHNRMQKFEDSLEAGTECRGTAFQAVSLTGSGRKEWRYYAADTNAFIESLNQDVSGHEVYPLEITSFLDPEWNALREFHSGSAQ